MKYRSEIDGLRAVAVIPVILFHAGFDLFRGGFVGVDVFFVISGYLITTILIEDIENERFSIVSFYERRARRILPALFFVMLVCIPLAWLWMSPSQMENFSESIIAVSLFASNILFWQESGYFDATAEEKPLLHTWSLAVEEQFYFLFPVFLILVWQFGKNRVFWMIAFLAIMSLLFSEWGWRNNATANFYLAPTRAWELFSGSIAAFIVQKYGIRKNNVLALLGLLAIIFSIFFYNENIPFPSIYALVPVVGVVMLILHASEDTVAAKLLCTKPLVGIGLISYSAYLWHQPLLAYARLAYIGEPNQLVMLGISVITFLFALFSYRFVENPFRKKNLISRKLIFILSISGIVLFVVLGACFKLKKPTRFNFQYFTETLIEEQNQRRFRSRQHVCTKKTWEKCDDPEDDKLNILIIGDSHSADAVTAILTAGQEMQDKLSISTSALGGCNAMPDTGRRLPNTWPNKNECIALNEKRYNPKFLNKYDLIVVNFLISSHWTVDDFTQYLTYLDDNFFGDIIAFGNTFIFEENLPSFLNRGGSASDIYGVIENDPHFEDQQVRVLEFQSVLFLSKYDVFCPNKTCNFLSDDGVLMSYDKHHLSTDYAKFLGDAYSGQIKDIFNNNINKN